MKTLAFDVETRKLASEVAEEHADALAGASAWTRPDLFLFECGVVIDLGTDVAFRYRDAAPMLAHLGEARRVVSYNGESFDLGVLSACGDVKGLRRKHLDINLAVMAALDEHPLAAEPGIDRIRQGGLDGLARANGLPGKTGSGIRAPELLREGRTEEALDYCENDVRLVASLYRTARQNGKLAVDGYTKRDGVKVELGPLEVPVEVVETKGEAEDE